MRRNKPEIIDVDHKRLRQIADRAKELHDPEDAELIARVFESYEYVAGLIQEKNMSIGRLQKMLFGAKTEKTNQVTGAAAETSATTNLDAAADWASYLRAPAACGSFAVKTLPHRPQRSLCNSYRVAPSGARPVIRTTVLGGFS